MLTFQRYRELCREASVALKLDDPDRLGNEGYMERDGIRVALFFDEEIVSDRIFCYVDLGPIVEVARTKIFERLLTLNLLSGTKTSGVYSIDPASGNAIFCVHLMNPDRISGDELGGVLNAYVARAVQLQLSVLRDVDDLDFMQLANHMFGMDEIFSQSELA